MGTDNSISRRSFIGAAPPPQRRQQWPHWPVVPPRPKKRASLPPTQHRGTRKPIWSLSAAEDAVLRPPSAPAENGASVIVLEAATTMGGSAVLCAGSFVAAGTKMQADAGITDDPDLYLSDVKGFLGDATIERAGDDLEAFRDAGPGRSGHG